MLQSGAQPEEEGPPPIGDEDEGAEAPAVPKAEYPDPGEINSNSPTIPVGTRRLARTPHKKFRDDPAVPPLQPTASRPRANVQPLPRRNSNLAPSNALGKSPNKAEPPPPPEE